MMHDVIIKLSLDNRMLASQTQKLAMTSMCFGIRKIQ